MKSDSARLTPIISKTRKELIDRGVRLLREGFAVPIRPKAPAAAAGKTSSAKIAPPARQKQPAVSQDRSVRNTAKDLLVHAPAIAQAYTEGLKSYRDLAKQYNCTLPTIQAILLMQRVEVRKAGRILGKESRNGDQQTKLSPQQREWMLKQDVEGRPHSEIALALGVSRERIRQLCQRAGHPARRLRTRAARERQTLKSDANRDLVHEQMRNAPPSTDVVTASMLWTRGDDIRVIAEALKRNPNSLGVQIARWRQDWPTLFPRRYRPHSFKN